MTVVAAAMKTAGLGKTNFLGPSAILECELCGRGNCVYNIYFISLRRIKNKDYGNSTEYQA